MFFAYKANVGDDRESPSYRLMEKLEELGAVVSLPVTRLTREFPQFAGRRSFGIDNGYDLMVIAA